MNSLRLLVAAALYAWLFLPCQSLAQCTSTLELNASLAANQSAEASINLTGELTTFTVNLNWSDQGFGSWAADMLLLIYAPDGSCVGVGGYSYGVPAGSGCTDLGSGNGAGWPDAFGDPNDWTSGNDGFYTQSFDLEALGLGGTGDWIIVIENAYNSSGGANYDIEFVFDGPCEGQCPDPDACNYVPEDEITNALLEVCEYPEDLFGPGYDCDGQCINDEDGDDICDEVDPCVGEYDACGVCNGPGEIYECGCYDADALGVCDGNCAVDADADGICDECIPPPGYWIDIEEVMVHTDGELDGMVTYRVSLGCESEADFLEAISGGGTGVLEIASSSGMWYNHPANPSWNPSGLVADSIALYPNLAYDSFLTIGADDAESGPFPSELGWTIEDPRVEFEPGGGNNLLIDAGNGSCYLSYPGLDEVGSHPGFAGDDLRVLLMQITTAGEISGQFVLRIRPVGQSPFTETLSFDSEDYCFNLDDCILDVCGVCNGAGEVYQCGCFDVPEGDCDCNGNQLDAIGVCGGACISDNNENGICDTEEFGCSDPEACNFVSADLMDDGSCEYPEQYYDCDGECINDENNNDICDELDLEGCMQDFSCNFNPEATIPDTSCIYPGDDCDDNDPETVNDEVTEDCGCEGEIPAPSGIDALTQWGIEMYPSPVQDVLRIQFRGEAHGATTFTMTSMSGQTVRARTLQSDATVDVSDLASGVYFATFEGTWGKATRRVMVASGR
ncbi:MAG: T9SS type A sorting domain-containing protein [Flavobacteriales bacterium]